MAERMIAIEHTRRSDEVLVGWLHLLYHLHHLELYTQTRIDRNGSRCKFCPRFG
jgi:hypothetical protein